MKYRMSCEQWSKNRIEWTQSTFEKRLKAYGEDLKLGKCYFSKFPILFTEPFGLEEKLSEDPWMEKRPKWFCEIL